MIKKLLLGHYAISRYFYYSVIVAIFDVAIVWGLLRFTDTHLVAANTIGVVSGFLFHYILASKSVFRTEYGVAGFLVYLVTFLFGLLLANSLIYVSYEFLFFRLPEDLRILASKGVSVAVPFFVMYYLRKRLYLSLNCKRG